MHVDDPVFPVDARGTLQAFDVERRVDGHRLRHVADMHENRVPVPRAFGPDGVVKVEGFDAVDADPFLVGALDRLIVDSKLGDTSRLVVGERRILHPDDAVVVGVSGDVIEDFRLSFH